MSKKLSAKCYEKNKEGLQKKNGERYQNLSKEEKEKNQQYDHKRYKNLSESLLSTKKILQNETKCLIVIIRNFYFKK